MCIVYLCVCVCERERQRQDSKNTHTHPERERVCVCVCVYVSETRQTNKHRYTETQYAHTVVSSYTRRRSRALCEVRNASIFSRDRPDIACVCVRVCVFSGCVLCERVCMCVCVLGACVGCRCCWCAKTHKNTAQ